MKAYQEVLDWITTQKKEMLACLKKWAQINSYSFNLPGLENFSHHLRKSFEALEAQPRRYHLPLLRRINLLGQWEEIQLGKAYLFLKRPKAKIQILLSCHMDTVYSLEGSRQILLKNKKFLYGPGVADAKGGLIVLWKALEAFERSAFKEKLGWRIFINPDEEIGSPCSSQLFKEISVGCSLALVYEPCLVNGHFISERKGSGNFTLVAHGRCAHAGRDPAKGRNAISALAQSIVEIDKLNNIKQGLTINMGQIEGGRAFNIVADLAIVRLNIRVRDAQHQKAVLFKIREIVRRIARFEKVKIDLYGKFSAPPKPFDQKTQVLFYKMKACGHELGLKVNWESSGGVCDGNRFAAMGIPTIDTMGPRGGGLHSSQEFIYTDSLIERTKLSALFLMKLANNDL